MRTLQLTNKDLNLSNHSFVMLDDRATLKQRIQNRFVLFLGEFSLSPNSGIDWFSLKESKNLDEIQKAFIRDLLSDSEIIRVNSFEVIWIDSVEKAKEYKSEIRNVIINYSVDTVYGVVSGGVV